MLGAVATRIAAMRGNVVGLEVLERDGGVAIDDLMVELPEVGMIDELCDQVRQIEGAGIEDVRPVSPDAEDRGLQVVAAAISILETANPTAALAALLGLSGELFEAEWTALADLRTGTYVECTGDVPSLEWLAAFALGARTARATDTSGVTEGSGVLTEDLGEVGLTLALGRSVPFRRRERREVEMLARVTDRACRTLVHADRIPPGW
jgi:hypothetical protein